MDDNIPALVLWYIRFYNDKFVFSFIIAVNRKMLLHVSVTLKCNLLTDLSLVLEE